VDSICDLGSDVQGYLTPLPHKPTGCSLMGEGGIKGTTSENRTKNGKIESLCPKLIQRLQDETKILKLRKKPEKPSKKICQKSV